MTHRVVTRADILAELESFKPDTLESNRRTCFFAHKQPNKPDVWYFVVMPGVSQHDFYRQATSLSYFSKRELTRVYGKKNTKNLADEIEYCRADWEVEYRMSDWDFYDKVRAKHKIGNALSQIPTQFIRIEGIWAFYEAIGYDRKAKKYKAEMK